MATQAEGLLNTQAKEKLVTVLIAVSSCLDEITICTNSLENTLKFSGSLKAELETSLFLDEKFMPYKNSLEGIFKNLYDIKNKCIREIQACDAVIDSVPII